MEATPFTIAMVNRKGGCAKTGTTHQLSGAFAKMGLRVLLIDMDPQASLTQGFFGPAATEAIRRELHRGEAGGARSDERGGEAGSEVEGEEGPGVGPVEAAGGEEEGGGGDGQAEEDGDEGAEHKRILAFRGLWSDSAFRGAGQAFPPALTRYSTDGLRRRFYPPPTSSGPCPSQCC